MKKIKICYLLNDFSVGGMSKVVYDIVSEIDYEKYEVSFICLRNDLGFAKQVVLPSQINIYTFDYQFDSDYSLRRYFKLAFFQGIIQSRTREIIDKIRELRPDILHLHVLPRELMIGIIARKALKNLELIYTDHTLRISETDSTPLKRNLLAFVYRKLYRKFHVVAVSKSVQNMHRRYNWLNKRNLNTLLENRINIKDYSQRVHHKNNNIQVIYVARLFDAKGHLELLKAWKQVQAPNRTLKLVGGGYLEDSIRKFIRENKLSGVILTGNVSNVKEHLTESDIAVFPSEKEGLPIAMLEKMAVGLPIVSSDIPELKDFIKDGINGLVYQLGKPEQLADMLNKLSSDHELRKKLGNNARTSLLDRMGQQTITELTCEHYLNVINH